MNWEIPFAEIGFWGNQKYAKQGYMLEAIKILTTYLKQNLGFNRIEALVDQENERANHLLCCAGFELEGVMRNAIRHPQTHLLGNLCRYAII